uniref:Uncharacterized protein n=1 Tax=Ixodes ricinus TaxID=34613 RepID=V5GPD1_IXORI
MTPLVVLPISVIAATGWLYLLTVLLPSVGNEDHASRLKFPSSHQDLKELAELLNSYNQDHAVYVIVLFYLGILVQANLCHSRISVSECVSRCSVWNLEKLSVDMYAVSNGRPRSAISCPSFAVANMSSTILPQQSSTSAKQGRKENRSRLLYWLLFLRLFPMTPNWFLNIDITCGGNTPCISSFCRSLLV